MNKPSVLTDSQRERVRELAEEATKEEFDGVEPDYNLSPGDYKQGWIDGYEAAIRQIMSGGD